MFAQLPHLSAARLLAGLAVVLMTLGLGLTGGASKPASADGSQWTRNQSNWNQGGSGWNRHWRSSQSPHSQFGNRSQIIMKEDTSEPWPVYFFVKGNPYKMWGIIEIRPAFVRGQRGPSALAGH